MIRKSVLSALALALALGAWIFIANSGMFAPGSAQANTDKQKVIHVVEHATSDTTIDTGAKGDTVGDLLTFANALYDATDKKVVGSDSGSCIRTIVGKLYECNWTIFLKEGQITVEGPFYDTADSTLSIIGGTGIYSDVRGQMKLHARGNPVGSEYDFVYSLE